MKLEAQRPLRLLGHLLSFLFFILSVCWLVTGNVQHATLDFLISFYTRWELKSGDLFGGAAEGKQGD